MASEDSGESRIIISEDNRSALIVVVTATLVAWTLGILGVRIASKLSAKIPVNLEEAGVIFSSILSIACSSAIFAGVKFHLGNSEDTVSDEDDISVSKALYAADILYILALGSSKGATVLLTYRITKVKTHIYACYGLGLFLALWAVASIFTIAIRDDISAPWLNKNDETQPDLLARWVAIESLSLAIEVAILGLATWIILGLQMPLTKKFKGVFAFMTRLPLVAPIGLRLFYLKSAFSAPDFTLAMTSAVISTQCALHYTVMAASFAYLKPFLSAFDSNLGATVKLDTMYGSSAPSARGGGSGQLKSDGSYNVGSLGNGRTGVGVGVGSQTDRKGERDERRRQRDSSTDSGAPIILKTQTFEVRNEDKALDVYPVDTQGRI